MARSCSHSLEVRLLNRRRFLTASTTAITATLALRPGLFAQLEKVPSSLPDSSLYTHNEEAYWGELRKQFLIPADEIYLNNGSAGRFSLFLLSS